MTDQQLTNNSLKEYYIKLLQMEENAVNMMAAMKQSLSSSASEVSIKMTNSDGSESNIRIPSFLYLENKIEQLENNFNNLFHMPDSGEAWFNNSNDMYKLELVKSGIAPIKPEFSTNDIHTGTTDNNILRDMVLPKTYLRLKIDNLPDNIEKMFMKKIIFHSLGAFTNIKNDVTLDSYDKYLGALYTLNKGVDYEEYDKILDLPTKANQFVSEFKIVEIPELEGGNPWVDTSIKYSDNHEHLSYKIFLNTLQYHNAEDSSIEYTLKPGDYISLPNKLVIYKVKHVNISENSIIIEEQIGHIALQTFEENSDMYLSLYDEDYSQYHYLDIPLEENQYIAIFLGTVHNGVRSLLSAPYIVDLSTIYMYDANDNKILDANGNHMTYMEYYNTYCINIGDLLLGMTKATYPQLSSYTNSILNNLQSGAIIKSYVNESFDINNIQVLPINKHLTDNTTTEEIINLNAQKAELQHQLTTLQTNIDNVYNTVVSSNVDPSEVTTRLEQFYTQRDELQKQLNAVITNINAANSNVTASRSKIKYCVRGITNVDNLETYVRSLSEDGKLDVIGLDVEYKYKSVTKDTTAVTSINSFIYTDWNKQPNIDKQRKLTFNSTGTSYAIEYENYGSLQNTIKWNQINVPITYGEDVIIRIRYKFNVGQPFINIYSPWSDEKVFVFPPEFVENTEVTNIFAQNEQDAITSRFQQTLVNDGYQQHVSNSITQNNIKYFHIPDNIYSGFNTPENNYISLKDKLYSMDKSINDLNEQVNSEMNKKYVVNLVHDGATNVLYTNTINKINIYNTEHISDSFVKNKMNIIIKNTGETPVKLYSIFPGNSDIPLLLDDEEFYEQYIVNYERVPIFIDDEIHAQCLGQWVYFRQNNPYTSENIYYQTPEQDVSDFNLLKNSTDKTHVIYNNDNNIIKKNNNQMLLGYRRRTTGEIETAGNKLIGLDFSGNGMKVLSAALTNKGEELNKKYGSKKEGFFKYVNDEFDEQPDMSNKYLCRFEDIRAWSKTNEKVYLDNETSMSEFINNISGSIEGMNMNNNTTFGGAFLYPDIKGKNTLLVESDNVNYIEIPVGKSLTIPVTFEYFINSEELPTITKSLYFDIRDTVTGTPKHYMLEITANYDYTSTGSIINKTTLLDNVTDY